MKMLLTTWTSLLAIGICYVYLFYYASIMQIWPNGGLVFGESITLSQTTPLKYCYGLWTCSNELIKLHSDNELSCIIQLGNSTDTVNQISTINWLRDNQYMRYVFDLLVASIVILIVTTIFNLMSFVAIRISLLTSVSKQWKMIFYSLYTLNKLLPIIIFIMLWSYLAKL